MALEASDRPPIDSNYVNVKYVDVIQGLPSNSVPLCLTLWENQKKSAKTSENKL
jgi:hypothetical protein